MHFQAWKKGLKSLYYLRSEAARRADVVSKKLSREEWIATAERIGLTGVTAEEVNRAKQQILKARERSSTDTASIGVALSEWAAQGDWRLYFLFRDRIEQVTPESVKAVAMKYLQRNNRTV